MEAKLGGIEFILAKVESLNLAQVDEIANLKVTLEACENKLYTESFADTENSVEPIIHQGRFHGFGEGWLAALQALGMPKDSLLRNPEQIPCLTPPPLVQSQADAVDEEDTISMRELVQAINTHIETVDLKVTSNLNAAGDAQV